MALATGGGAEPVSASQGLIDSAFPTLRELPPDIDIDIDIDITPR